MIDFIALKILAFLTLLHTPNQALLSDDWQVVLNWVESNGQYVFQAESRELANFCHNNPSFYINFPTVFHSSHEILGDSILLGAANEQSAGAVSSFFASPTISCNQLKGLNKITWIVYSPSRYFTWFLYPPEPMDHPPFVMDLVNSLHLVVSAVMIFWGIFLFYLFYKKAPLGILLVMVISNLFFSSYVGFTVPRSWGIHISMHAAEKAADGSLVVAFGLMLYLFYYQKLLSRLLFAAYVLIAPFSLITIVFGSSLDVSQSGLNIILFFVLVSFIEVLIKSFIKFQATGNIYAFICMLSILTTCSNDILLVGGYLNSYMIFPIGIVSYAIFQAFYIQDQIKRVYNERETFRNQLDLAYEEKLKIMQENAVAHTIANTTQLIAHDIRKPFAMLNVVVDALAKPDVSSQMISHLIGYIKETSVYVDNLLANILLSSKRSTNKLKSFDLLELINTMKSRVAIEQRRNIIITTDLRHNGHIHADKTKITQLLNNLLSNAIEATRSDPLLIWINSIELQTSEQRFVKIYFGNAGSYITKEDISKLFEPDFTKGKINGLGLGLAICKDIVLSHGGQIDCQSDDSRGTEFTFTLPLA